MNFEEVLSFVKEQVVVRTKQPLTNIEAELLRFCWDNNSYADMEENFHNYTSGYVITQIAPKLWNRLTIALNQNVKITKKTVKNVLMKTLVEYRNIKGQVLKERFLINEVINEGELSKIYLAQDLRLNNQLCMVKQMIRKTNDEIIHRKFNIEINFLYQLGWHPQIPGLINHFEDENSFYLVYQYVEGETLSQQLPEDKLGSRWDEDSVINLLMGILNILEFIHKMETIHRDIRPSNLIRNSQGNIYLINFGSIKDLGLLRERTFLGTIGYSAPEQWSGIPKYQSDIYSVAMLGIQALTGVPPIRFKMTDDAEVIWQQEATVSEKLAKILNRMADPDWKKRYSSVRDIIKDMQQLSAVRI